MSHEDKRQTSPYRASAAEIAPPRPFGKTGTGAALVFFGAVLGPLMVDAVYAWEIYAHVGRLDFRAMLFPLEFGGPPRPYVHLVLPMYVALWLLELAVFGMLWHGLAKHADRLPWNMPGGPDTSKE